MNMHLIQIIFPFARSYNPNNLINRNIHRIVFHVLSREFQTSYEITPLGNIEQSFQTINHFIEDVLLENKFLKHWVAFTCFTLRTNIPYPGNGWLMIGVGIAMT